jgi:hypothetical protein
LKGFKYLGSKREGEEEEEKEEE